jgi:hypothetical protein
VVLYTIAPTLPFFAKKVMMRCPVGKLMDVYVLSIDEETATILPQLIKNAFKFLKCP